METQAINEMISDLLRSKVIEESVFEEGDFMNTVFLREKRDSTPSNRKFRMILNMKNLNKQFVELIHHKMHSLQTCLDLMEPNCYMASIDLKDAFHTIPMDPFFTKFLKFQVGSKVYKYIVLPMGYRDSPRMFCKILKPVLAYLRKKGHLSSLYIDDFFLLGRWAITCEHNVKDTESLLKALGFEISDKSVREPSQQLIHLGFVLNSVTMSVSLSEDKRDNILVLINNILTAVRVSIRFLAKVIGTLIASLPGVEYGPLYYRELEFLKIRSLAINFNYDNETILNSECLHELNWWKSEGLYSSKVISHGNPDFIMQSDSSGFAWGALLTHSQARTQGLWGEEEKLCDINVLELKAAFLGITALGTNLHDCHLQLQLDNQTAVTYINNMGGTHSIKCNEYAKQLILWGKCRNIWISACHIAGIDNCEADILSRKINENIEWMIIDSTFVYICSILGKPEIDLFASRLNHRLPKYMSLCPDAEALAINAFAHRWDSFIYIFAPFNLIPRILRKLSEDKTEKALMIVPQWHVATWFPKINQMRTRPPIIITSDNLTLAHKPNVRHPLFPKLKLMAFLLSGKNSNETA